MSESPSRTRPPASDSSPSPTPTTTRLAPRWAEGRLPRSVVPITDRLVDPILDALAVAPGCRLLDVACAGQTQGRAAVLTRSGVDVAELARVLVPEGSRDRLGGFPSTSSSKEQPRQTRGPHRRVRNARLSRWRATGTQQSGAPSVRPRSSAASCLQTGPRSGRPSRRSWPGKHRASR